MDFGGQYNQLIARRVRSLNVYAEIINYDKITCEEIKDKGYKGIIFTGGPNSVYDESSPHYSPDILNLGIPILGICYGHQLLAYMAKGTIESAKDQSEYGKTILKVKEGTIFKSVPKESIVWMSHTDYVSKVPDGFTVTAVTDVCPCAGMENKTKNIYG